MRRLALTLGIGALGLLSIAPAALAASASTNPASAVHHRSAVLHGLADPSGDPGITECHFDWVEDAQFQIDGFASAATLPCEQGNSFTSPTEVSATLGFLDDGFTYHYRLSVQSTSSGTLSGAERSFFTPGFPILRTRLGSFGPDGTQDSTFSGAGPLAFRSSTHELFALNGRFSFPVTLSGFDAGNSLPFPLLTNTTLPASTSLQRLAVDSTALPSAGNIYYMDLSEGKERIAGLDSSGSPLGGNFPVDPTLNPGVFVATTETPGLGGIAVAPDGALWVANLATGQILKYSANGSFLDAVDLSARFPYPTTGGPWQIALSANGDLYAGNYFGDDPPPPNQGVWKFTAASGYTAATRIDRFTAEWMAVDVSNGHVFVVPRVPVEETPQVNASEIREYDEEGNLLGRFARKRVIEFTADGKGLLRGYNISGIAVDPGSHHAFVANSVYHHETASFESQITVYDAGTPQVLPTLTERPPERGRRQSATLNARVDPEGEEITDCHFE